MIRIPGMAMILLLLSGCGGQNGQGNSDVLARVLGGAGVAGLLLAIYNVWWDRRKFNIQQKQREADKAEARQDRERERAEREQQKKETQEEKDRESRAREEENQERVRVTVDATEGPDGGNVLAVAQLRVEVLNLCNFTIPIRSVELKCRQEETGNPLALPLVAPSIGPKGGQRLEGGVELEPRKARWFVLFIQDQTFKVVQMMSGCPPERVWISVSSHRGEVERIQGQVVIPVLQTVVKSNERRTSQGEG